MYELKFINTPELPLLRCIADGTKKAEGRIAAEMVAPYPPGIPLICPGEQYRKEVLELIRQYLADGCEFHGPTDASLETLYVLKEEK